MIPGLGLRPRPQVALSRGPRSGRRRGGESSRCSGAACFEQPCDNSADAATQRRSPASGAVCRSPSPAFREAHLMAAVAAGRELLFGLLALQNGLINQAQLLAAFQAWTLERSKGLADHLVALGHLAPARRPVVEAIAALHLEAHGGDVEKILAAVPASRSARASLAGLGEPDIEATLARVAPGANGQATEADDDPDRTGGFAVGESTVEGQRFRILRPHARGGLGEVFVALDAELHREVALKQILEKHADDPVSRRRFVAEAEITGGLEHPGVVPVYGLGAYSGGRPYYAMRFIRGDSLKEAIDHFHGDDALKDNPGRRSLELRKLLRRFTDICNAVDYAHSRGVKGFERPRKATPIDHRSRGAMRPRSRTRP